MHGLQGGRGDRQGGVLLGAAGGLARAWRVGCCAHKHTIKGIPLDTLLFKLAHSTEGQATQGASTTIEPDEDILSCTGRNAVQQYAKMRCLLQKLQLHGCSAVQDVRMWRDGQRTRIKAGALGAGLLYTPVPGLLMNTYNIHVRRSSMFVAVSLSV